MRTLKSELKDRKLRFDGVSEIKPDQLARFLLLGVPPEKLRVDGNIAEFAEFNQQVAEKDQIFPIHNDPVQLDMSWNLPEKYQKIDLFYYFTDRLVERIDSYNEAELLKAIDRMAMEVEEVHRRGMVEFMRTVIYIIDQLKAKNIVWGVGRGSSCASYLLFLVGLHVVDCVKMDVSPDEFYHD